DDDPPSDHRRPRWPRPGRVKSAADPGIRIVSVLPRWRGRERDAPMMTDAIENAGRLRRLQLITDTALSHLRLDELLEALLGRTREMLDVDTCAVLLLDEKRQELVARAAVGLEEEVERGIRIPVGLGFAGRVAAER